MRQHEDENDFKEIISSLREYTVTAQHVKCIQQFQWQHISEKYGRSGIDSMMMHGLFEFQTHREICEHNKQKLKQLNETYPVAK